MKISLIIFLGYNLLHLPVMKEVLIGKVVDVHDGNTIEVLIVKENVLYKIQLAGIDCPEIEQPFGLEAKHLLEKKLMGEKVEVVVEGKNRWGIRQAVVTTTSGDDLRLKLLAEGLAWTSEKNAIPEFELIRIKAKAQHKGLWKSEDPIPPWIFRRQQTMVAPKSSW
jgi:endonuclease YncB( thermonuclease family)